MSWNPAKHPRDSRGRFTYVRGSVARNTKIGRGGKYYGVKTGAEFKVGKNGGQVLVKGMAGYAPPETKGERVSR